jgi:hypothetical protein
MSGSSYRDMAEPPAQYPNVGIVTAMLIWYDEPPELLSACIRGLGDVADRVVAVDGAYRRYPGAAITSPPAQARAIRAAAKRAKLECLVLTPDRLWAGQVEKRSYGLAAAAVGTDWIVVIDADHIVHADRDAVRRELASVPLEIDVVTVEMTTPRDLKRGIVETSATGWHRGIADVTMPYAHIFRALPGLRIERFHWWFSAVKDGRRVWISGAEPNYGKAGRMESRYVVEHRCHQRDKAHMLAGRAFCNDRVKVVERTGQEDDVPGLPRPVWDYVTVPY